MPEPRATPVERVLRPVHRWIWRDGRRSARKLITFARTEADGGRDLSRAAEQTSDPLLRRLYLRHASDEQRHAELFRARGRAILTRLGAGGVSRYEARWIAPGERGLDDLRVGQTSDASLLAFLHLSERAAASRFAAYRDVIADDETRDVFCRVLRDEVFHMTYTRSQLRRIDPRGDRRRLWLARAGRLWKAYLRAAAAIAKVLGGLILIAQYFVVLPAFAWLAKRAWRREPLGWTRRSGTSSLSSQY